MKIGVTGHRNQRLSLPEDETDEKWTPIQFWIIDELSKFIKTCADNNEHLIYIQEWLLGVILHLRLQECQCIT